MNRPDVFRSKRKGFAYTSFAILASTSILVLAFSSVMSPHNVKVSNAERIGGASFFVDSLFSDMDRASRIANRRALTATTNHVVLTGDSLKQPRKNISEVMVNGTLNGKKLNSTVNASLSDWTSRIRKIADNAGYSLDVHVVNYTFDPDYMSMHTSLTVFASLKDPTTLATFNRTRSTRATVDLADLEDSMLLIQSKGRYVNKYEKCGFSDPAVMRHTGTQNSTGYVQGYAVVSPADATTVSNKSKKILVVDNINDYSSSTVADFAGSVSSQEASFSTSSISHYVYGTGSISGLEDNESLVLNNEQVWDTGFRKMFQDGCYIRSPEGPDFLDRMQNKLVNDGGSGIATLIDVSTLPPALQKTASAVGYVYFNDTANHGSLRRVKGVTETYSWFRLDQDHIDRWSMNALAQ
ncbi:MAG: hypothetical protein ABEJ99_01430 [Candidatus Nanohaloarchaea archaeon]